MTRPVPIPLAINRVGVSSCPIVLSKRPGLLSENIGARHTPTHSGRLDAIVPPLLSAFTAPSLPPWDLLDKRASALRARLFFRRCVGSLTARSRIKNTGLARIDSTLLFL